MDDTDREDDIAARGADDRRGARRGAVVVQATALAALAGCATEAHRALEPQPVASAGAPYQGPKSTLVVGKFDNRSSYLRGLFSDGVDLLGGQAKGILVTHLQQTGRFAVVERDNLEEITREAAIKGQQQLKGADFAITGDVAEFGRKEVVTYSCSASLPQFAIEGRELLHGPYSPKYGQQ
jgi:curli biogenesis system outer membrane secretion channel CsgG